MNTTIVVTDHAMSSVSAGLEPLEIVARISAHETYRKVEIISYLTRTRIRDCYRDFESDSDKLIACAELSILKDLYGLVPFGPDDAEDYYGQYVIDAQMRRATNLMVESPHRRLSRKQIRAIEETKHRAQRTTHTTGHGAQNTPVEETSVEEKLGFTKHKAQRTTHRSQRTLDQLAEKIVSALESQPNGMSQSRLARSVGTLQVRNSFQAALDELESSEIIAVIHDFETGNRRLTTGWKLKDDT